jgi:hypothetical protein
MKLRELLADALGTLLDPVFRLLEWPIERFIFKWARGDEKWECSTDWMARAAAEGLYEYPAWKVAVLRWTPADPSARPGFILLIWSIPLPTPPDDECRPIRGPPDRVKPKRRSI